MVCYKSFCEGDVRMWYHHINFTAKAKGAVDCKFFFAEVIFMRGELPISCLCLVTPDDDGNISFTLCNFLLLPDLLSS